MHKGVSIVDDDGLDDRIDAGIDESIDQRIDDGISENNFASSDNSFTEKIDSANIAAEIIGQGIIPDTPSAEIAAVEERPSVKPIDITDAGIDGVYDTSCRNRDDFG